MKKHPPEDSAPALARANTRKDLDSLFIDGLQQDPAILAFHLLRPNCAPVRNQRDEATEATSLYEPDFLVRTAHAVYMVKIDSGGLSLTDECVQRELKQAALRCTQINRMESGSRSALTWHYVLLLEQTLRDWLATGKSVSDLLAFAKLRAP
jgi:hypothetical protein